MDKLSPRPGDVVEVAPAYDHAEIACVAAATVAFDLITLMSKTRVSTAAELAVTVA